jgi:hypothetical protein
MGVRGAWRPRRNARGRREPICTPLEGQGPKGNFGGAVCSAWTVMAICVQDSPLVAEPLTESLVYLSGS